MSHLYCFNCTSTTHGFLKCPRTLHFCKKCRTPGHPERRCSMLNSNCWVCAQKGIVVKKNACIEHKNLKSCGIMIVDESDNILCARGAISGIWSLPKGCQDNYAETYKETAIRETYEEIGIKFDLSKNDKYISFQRFKYFVVKITNSMKKLMNKNIKLQLKEIVGWKWIHYDDLQNHHTNASLQYIRNNYDNIIKNYS